MNSPEKSNVLIVTVFLILFLLPGCGSKSATQKLGATPQIAVYFLGADTSKLDSDEVETFNEIAVEMTNNLIADINKWGFEATLLKTQVGTFNRDSKGYLLRFSLTPHRLVSGMTRSIMGTAAGPNIVENHFEFIDLQSKQMITWGEYTRESELSMEIILQRKINDAIFKIDTFIDRQ